MPFMLSLTLSVSLSASQHVYLAQAHVGHLKLVLVDAPPQAAIKLFDSSTQCSLREQTFMYMNANTHILSSLLPVFGLLRKALISDIIIMRMQV